MTLRDETRNKQGEFDAAQAARDLGQLRRERDTARKVLKDLERENAQLRATVDLFGRVDEADPSPPDWLAGRPEDQGDHHATLMLLLSDMHFDEVVKPEEVKGLNAYNREIATLRLKRWTDNVVKMARVYLAGLTWDGVVLMLGGDTFSGTIHDELRETNEDTVFGSLLYWSELLAAPIDVFAEEFGRVYVPAVPGNHGRQTRKPRAKLRSRDNLDWLLANMVAKEFRRDDRVTFDVPDAADCYFDVYGRGQLLTHGDQVSGGQGVGGIWPPIMRMRGRKSDNYASVGKTFETLWMGHWHQLIPTPFLVINGAMKGHDEYAEMENFRFETARQAIAVMTPEHGMTWAGSVFCSKREDEGW